MGAAENPSLRVPVKGEKPFLKTKVIFKSPERNFVILDKGEKNGFKKGQVVCLPPFAKGTKPFCTIVYLTKGTFSALVVPRYLMDRLQNGTIFAEPRAILPLRKKKPTPEPPVGDDPKTEEEKNRDIPLPDSPDPDFELTDLPNQDSPDMKEAKKALDRLQEKLDAKKKAAGGAQGKDDENKGPNALGADGKGADGKGADGKGADGKGADGKGADGKGADGKGADGKGADGKGADGKGADGKGGDGKGADGKGGDGKGADGKGADGKGADGKGADGKGADGKGTDKKDEKTDLSKLSKQKSSEPNGNSEVSKIPKSDSSETSKNKDDPKDAKPPTLMKRVFKSVVFVGTDIEYLSLIPQTSAMRYNTIGFQKIDPSQPAAETAWRQYKPVTKYDSAWGVQVRRQLSGNWFLNGGFRLETFPRDNVKSDYSTEDLAKYTTSQTSVEAVGFWLDGLYQRKIVKKGWWTFALGPGIDFEKTEVYFRTVQAEENASNRVLITDTRSRLFFFSGRLLADTRFRIGPVGLSLGSVYSVPLTATRDELLGDMASPDGYTFPGDEREDLKKSLGHEKTTSLIFYLGLFINPAQLF